MRNQMAVATRVGTIAPAFALIRESFKKTPSGFRFGVDEGMAFSFGASSLMTNSVRKEIWPRSNKKERGHRRKKMPMDAEWGHGRAEAAAHGCQMNGMAHNGPWGGHLVYYQSRLSQEERLSGMQMTPVNSRLFVGRIDSACDQVVRATRPLPLYAL